MTSPTPDKAAADLEKWATQLEQKAQRYQQMQRQLDQTSVTETSPDGMFRVTVDANGVPTELGVAERARGVDPAQISAGLMATMRRAQGRLRAQVQELVQTSVGDDGPGQNLVAQYRERFPEPPADQQEPPAGPPQRPIGGLADDEPRTPAPPPPPRPPRRPRPDDDDDDGGWADQPIRR